MEYKDIKEIAEKLYLDNSIKRNYYWEHSNRASRKGQHNLVDIYNDMGNNFAHKNEGIIQLLAEIEKLADQLGEDTEEMDI